MDTQTILEAVGIIREIKSLFAETDPYFPVYAALGGAFVGAVATIIPTSIVNWLATRKERKSTALQIYAEIGSYLEVIKHRKYIEDLEQIVQKLKTTGGSNTYQIQVNDERFIIFKNLIGKLGLLNPDLQIKIVQFYQFLEAIIQDVKPGGMLNSQPTGLKAFEEALYIAKQVNYLGEEIIKLISKKYI